VIIQRAAEKLLPFLHTASSAELLESSVRDAAMFIRRTTYSPTDTIEYTECIVRGDFFVYTVELT